MKQCSRCRRSLLESEFNIDRTKKDGLKYHCRACDRLAGIRNYAKNSDKLRLRARNYVSRNHDKVRAIARKSYYKRIDKERARMRKWQRENRAWSKAWRECNPDKWLAYSKRWQAKNPAKYRAQQSRRRARVRNALCDSNADIAKWVSHVRDAPRLRCHWCKCIVARPARTLDHVIALARGGSHTVANFCMSCRSCNSRKGDKSTFDWNGQDELLLH